MESLKELKERVWEANMELPRRGLVTYTFGNVSGIDRDRGIAVIKPSGVPYEELSPEMMVLVDLENKVIDSNLEPSSDTRTHTILYKHFNTIGGIVHTHSTYATSWAQALRPIPCLGTSHADHIPREIPCTDVMTDDQVQGDYEVETGLQIIERFKDLSCEDVPMVLVAYHGAFSWGKTPETAVYNSVILEELAEMALYTLTINPSVRAIDKTLIDKHFLRKHGKNSYYGQIKK
ncbi:L-ribulose-5-phosphate 4-epimerase [Candidatus Latescibacterota bacterium]